MMVSKKLLPLLLLCSVFTSCGMKKQLDEMHDSTVTMNGSTQQMKDNTEKMGDTTADMNASMQTMITLLRSKEAEDTRRNAFIQLGESKSLLRKFELASVYFMSFEFQLWTLSQTDKVGQRDFFYRLAAEEFFTSITEYIEDYSFGVNGINPASKKDDQQNLFAFAVGMHYIHENQLRTHSVNPDYKVVSFYDLIEQALLKMNDYNSGVLNEGDLTPSDVVVLRNYDIAIYLMHMRYNIFSTLALSRLSKIDRKGLLSNAGKLIKGWKLDLSELSRAQQIESIEYLEYANEARALLDSIGIKTSLDGKINRIFKNMRLIEQESGASLIANNQPKIKTLVDKILNK